MKNEDGYQAWMQSRRQIDVDRGFSERVMDRLARDAVRRATCPHLWLLTERGCTARWAKAAAVGFAVLIGVARAFLTLHVLFFA